MRSRCHRKCVAPAPKVKAVQPFGAKDDFPPSIRSPKPASAGPKFDEIVEVVSANVPGEVLDGVCIESGVGAKLEKAEAFVRLAITNPTSITMVVREISAHIGKPVTAP